MTQYRQISCRAFQSTVQLVGLENLRLKIRYLLISLGKGIKYETPLNPLLKSGKIK